MPEMERFSSLIGEIYDASLDPALWPDVFEKACGYIGGSAANLISQDTIKRNANHYFSCVNVRGEITRLVGSPKR